MSENKFQRCQPEDPDRCQAVGKDDQCPYKSLDGSDYCARHGGNRALNAQATINLRNLRLTRAHAYMDRAKELGDSAHIKSVRDEIAILRLILEKSLMICNTPADLLCNSPMLSDLVLKIEKLVSSAHRLELNLGELLDKSAVVQLTAELVEIIGEGFGELTDKLIEELGEGMREKVTQIVNSAIIDKICERITQATVQAGRKDNGSDS